MTEQRISLETAKLAKEVGFNWRVQFYYSHKNIINDDGANLANYNQEGLKTLSAPTQGLLQKWLREVHYLMIVVNFKPKQEEFCASIVYQDKSSLYWRFKEVSSTLLYEDTLEIALYEALLLIKTTENDK